MQAVHVPASGQQAALAELPAPTPGAGEVLIQVRAAGLNPFDNHIAAGWLEAMLEHRYPLVLGRDASGVVEAVGQGVTDVAVGDEVIAHVPFGPVERGTLADHVVLPASSVAAKPAELDHVTAAALPLAAGAALTLIDAVDPQPGQVVHALEDVPVDAQAAAGTLQVDVARVVPMGEALEALADIAAHRAHGRIVVDLSL